MIMSDNEVVEKWENFKIEIKCKNRYNFNREIIYLLDSIPRFSTEISVNPTTLEKNMKFYRARVGQYKEKKNLLAPHNDLTKAGRFNPEGIAYLYLSSSLEGAVAEVRPNLGDIVTIAEFDIKDKKVLNLALINLNPDTVENSIKICSGPTYKFCNDVRKLCLLLEDEFKSVVTVLNKIEYVPLQFVAEYIKGLGFDGIVFSSITMENQYNYVIFNYDDIDERNIINMYYREVTEIKYSTKTV